MGDNLLHTSSLPSIWIKSYDAGAIGLDARTRSIWGSCRFLSLRAETEITVAIGRRRKRISQGLNLIEICRVNPERRSVVRDEAGTRENFGSHHVEIEIVIFH